MFNLITPISYWVLIALWLIILGLYLSKLRHLKVKGGAIAVLLSILAIDAFRTVFESLYFGLYFNSLFGLLPKGIHALLSQPSLVIIPKIINVAAGFIVLFLLIYRWIPREIRDREELIDNLQEAKRFAYKKKEEAEEQASKLETIFNSIADSIILTDTDRRIVTVNKGMEKMFGYTLDDLAGKTTATLYTSKEEYERQGRIHYNPLAKKQNEPYEVNYRRKNGEVFIGETLGGATIEAPQGEISGYIGVIRDITERKRSEDQLLMLSRVVESSSSLVIITDLDGNIEYVNPKFNQVTGYSNKEVIGQNPRILKSGLEHMDADYVDLWETITSGREWDGEFNNRKKDGSFYRCLASISGVRDSTGVITHFISVQEDVTHQYKLLEQLSYQESHDVLTGLVNRRAFEHYLERLLLTKKQNRGEHALCLMDLDQFKVINDTCGYVVADEMLRQISLVLKNAVRNKDTVARLGGDEFGVLMENCSPADAERVSNTLLKSINDYTFKWEGDSFKIGVSIGLVPISEAILDSSDLLKKADIACYMAKDKGRNRIHIYHNEDIEIAQRHGEMKWLSQINQALEENRFRLYAQPIVALDGSNEEHYELLLRMLSKKGKIIPPDAFLPAAERYDLTTKIDRWVIENAFRLFTDNPVFLKQMNFCSINLSGLSLTNPEILKFIISQLNQSGIDGNKICFEITETAAISNLNMALEFIKSLKRVGCRFALDDFGSGLSSFAYLKNLPVDYLKIDGMFVKHIDDDPIDHAMVKSINEIAHVMGMQTIAEFVENDIIKGMLKELGVDYGQGYGFAKPCPIDELLDRSNNVTDIKRPKFDGSEP